MAEGVAVGTGGYVVAYEYLDPTRQVLVGLLTLVGTAALAGVWWFVGDPRRAVRDWRARGTCDPTAVALLPVTVGVWCVFVLPMLADLTGGETVEGEVRGLTVASRYARPGDRPTEATFAVGDRPFRVTRRNSRPGEVLDLPRWPGGPLRDGMSVRVCHWGGTILVLEVRERPAAEPGGGG